MGQPDIDTVLGWRGRTIVDRDGEKIGKFDEIYLDTSTDRPEWAQVKMGLLGRDRALVPLTGAQEAGDDLQVPFDKASVEAAPDVDPDVELSQEAEAELYRHYGVDYSDEPTDTVMPREEPGTGDAGEAAAGAGAGAGAGTGAAEEAMPATHEREEGVAPGGAGTDVTRGEGVSGGTGTDVTREEGVSGGTGTDVTRSEEEVRMGVEQRPRERVRLKKYVVTEHVTQTVPVQREEVRLEREPIEGEPAGETSAGPDREDPR